MRLPFAVFRDGVRALAVEVGPDRVVGLTEEGGVRPGADVEVGLGVQQPRQADVARDGRLHALGAVCCRRAPFLQIIDDRADERPVLRIARAGLQVRRVGRHAGDGVGHAVHRIGVRHRADHGHPVHHPGHARQLVADGQARHARGDGLHLSLDFGRGLGLGVEGLVLRRRAVGEEQDAGFGLAERAVAFRCRRPAKRLRVAGPRFTSLCIAEPQEVAQRKPERSQAADVQEVAAGEAVAQRPRRAENAEHNATRKEGFRSR